MFKRAILGGLLLGLCACGGGGEQPAEDAGLDGGSSEAALSACGSGLYCRGYSIAGSSACLSGSTTVYCCPAGQTITSSDRCSGAPSTPACGSGLYCAGSSIPGASACMSGSSTVYCCPSGQTIVNGACSGSVPACGSGLYCAVNSLPGAAACRSGSQTLYCCPSGQTIVNGVCSALANNFCSTNCGCDAQGNNCNFGTRNTDSWCKCCAENCGGNQAACVQQGYKGDAGFPAGTSRQCGCINSFGNGHDFGLADSANLGSCYQNLRANSNITSGYQTIWHPGVSGCSDVQHVHILSSSASGVNRFGIDCLGQTTYGGQACTHDATGCYFLWQGPL